MLVACTSLIPSSRNAGRRVPGSAARPPAHDESQCQPKRKTVTRRQFDHVRCAAQRSVAHPELGGPFFDVPFQRNVLRKVRFGGAPHAYQDPTEVGLEAGQDLVTIDSGNPNRIDWNTLASIPGDSVRVITESVPEPSSLLLLGTGLLGLAANVSVKRKLFCKGSTVAQRSE